MGLNPILKEATRDYLGLDFSAISEAYFGNRLYANVLLLGAAYERGHLPLSLENLQKAVGLMVPAQDRDENLRAFELGRQAAARPERFARYSPHLPGSWKWWRTERNSCTGPTPSGLPMVPRVPQNDGRGLRWMDLPEPARARLAQYVYDLFQWGGPDYARRYVTRLWGVYRKDQKERGFQATLAVLGNLHQGDGHKRRGVCGPASDRGRKHRRDRARYNVNEERGDRLDYVHFNRPNFTVLGRNIQFDWRSRQWQLHLMKHLGVLRRLLPLARRGARVSILV
jgi:indolepyruvate ferredoxin oxidoreductase